MVQLKSDQGFDFFNRHLSVVFFKSHFILQTISTYISFLYIVLHVQHVVPVGKSVDALLNAFRVDVVLADQTFSCLDHSFDPVQVQLHGGGEVLVFLYSRFHCFHCGGQLHVSKRRLLEDKDRRSHMISFFSGSRTKS